MRPPHPRRAVQDVRQPAAHPAAPEALPGMRGVAARLRVLAVHLARVPAATSAPVPTASENGAGGVNNELDLPLRAVTVLLRYDGDEPISMMTIVAEAGWDGLRDIADGLDRLAAAIDKARAEMGGGSE